ncbi:MAG: hypothetical protein VKJ64_21530 [Leptolyngbyaceae bacterium]|nr:hypothetical protein [Leptolyngbyaceae bacterium]
MDQWFQVDGVIIQGHRVASGQNQNPRFPGGTLRMQTAAFAERGLDLTVYFPGTLNISIAPLVYGVRRSLYTLRQVKWAEHCPAEDFSFFNCRLRRGTGPMAANPIDGLIYYPHPETKPEHFQEAGILEVLAPLVENVSYGDRVILDLDPQQIEILD